MNDDFGKLPTSLRNELSNLTWDELYTILKTEAVETSCETANWIKKKVLELSLFSHFTYSKVE